MSNPTSAADRLSFALPDWSTALKRRVRRPRKPDFWDAYYLAGFVILCAFALQDVLSGDYPRAGVMLVAVGLWWKALHYRRAGRETEWNRCIILLCIVTFVGLFIH